MNDHSLFEGFICSALEDVKLLICSELDKVYDNSGYTGFRRRYLDYLVKIKNFEENIKNDNFS